MDEFYIFKDDTHILSSHDIYHNLTFLYSLAVHKMSRNQLWTNSCILQVHTYTLMDLFYNPEHCEHMDIYYDHGQFWKDSKLSSAYKHQNPHLLFLWKVIRSGSHSLYEQRSKTPHIRIFKFKKENSHKTFFCICQDDIVVQLCFLRTNNFSHSGNSYD